MGDLQKKTPESLKDFLSFLPVLCNNHANNVSDYFIWKTLTICLHESNDNIDWRTIIQTLEDVYLNQDDYTTLLKDDTWKKTFLRNYNPDTSCPNDHHGTMCMRLSYPIDTVYYCFTCITNPLYEICEFCFDPKKHEGHDYISKVVTKNEGGVCHCGNPSIYKLPQNAFKCKNDSNNIQSPQSNSKYNNDGEEIIQSTINTVLDYIINTSIENNEFDAITSLADNQKNESDNLDSYLDFGMKEGPKGTNELSTINSSNSIQLSHLSQFQYNKNIKEKWVLQIHEEDISIHPRDLCSKITTILNKPPEYAISIVDQLQTMNSPVTILESDDIAKLEDIRIEFVRQNVKVSLTRLYLAYKHHLIECLIGWLYTMTKNETEQYPFLECLRLSFLDGSVGKQISSSVQSNEAKKHIHDINLFGDFYLAKEEEWNEDPREWYYGWEFTECLLVPKIREIMERYNDSIYTYGDAHRKSYAIPGSRFQRIIEYCLTRISSNNFYQLLNIIGTVFSLRDKTRACISAQYADIYLTLLKHSVIDNDDRSMAVMGLLSQYTFQDPEYANDVIRHRFVERTLRFAFVLMNHTPNDKSNNLIKMYASLTLPTDGLQNKRTIVCFKELCILLSTNTIAQELFSDQHSMECVLSAFDSFNNILSLKREVGKHVEYENFEFSSLYFFFASLLIMTDSYIRSLSLIFDPKFREMIIESLLWSVKSKEYNAQVRREYVQSGTSAELKVAEDEECALGDDIHEALPTVKETICNHTSEVINFQVGVDSQCILHPMAYLFKFIIQWSLSGRYEYLPKHLRDGVDIKTLTNDPFLKRYIVEASLCTLVLLGQIEVGFWVRNGAPVAHQAKMYTKYSMREFTYASDIFNVQFGMCNMDPRDFVVTYLNRWSLKNWANGTPIGDYPDEQTTVRIVNEAVILLIRALTEMKSVIITSSVDSFERTLRTEIIHAVSFKHVTYEQIVDEIPEHVTKHVAFDLYLTKYTDFHTASNANETGTFTLKKEHEEEIDPYYYGLTSNRRYEIEKEVRMKMQKDKGISFDNTYVPPKKVIDKLQKTPFADLFAITSVDCFGLFLKNTLDYIKKFKYDTLLIRIVYLIHIAVVNNIHDFTKIFWREYAIVDTEFYHYHSIGSLLYSILSMEEFSNIHGGIKQIFFYLRENAPHVDIDSYLLEQTISYDPDLLWSNCMSQQLKDIETNKKKEKARLRKEKILRKLGNQQKKFLQNNTTPSSEEENVPGSTMSSQHSLSSEIPGYMGWKFPDDFCIFCKMTKENSAFVYFSYEEVGICDHILDIRNVKEQKLGPLEERPLIRICGHGSHITCLGKHLKSARAVQSQTTKNIPNSFGYGLLYCPVCNSMSNCFIPKVKEYNPRRVSEFSHKDGVVMGNIIQDVSIFNGSMMGQESVFILRDLMDRDDLLKLGTFDVINELLINTTSNLELRLRYDMKPKFHPSIFKNGIPGQCLLTLRLLSELKSLIFHSDDRKDMDLESVVYSSDHGWYNNIVKHFDTNLLLYVSLLFEKIESLDCTANECLLKIIKMKFFQDLLALNCNLTKANCNINDEEFTQYLIKNDEMFDDDDDDADDNNEISNSTIDNLINLIQRTLSNVCKDSRLLKCSFDRIAPFIYKWLKQSMTVFLRRSYLLLLSRYPDEYDHIVITKRKDLTTTNDEFEFYLQRFKINGIKNFDLLLQNFTRQFEQEKDIRQSLSNYYSESNVNQKLGNLKFASPDIIKLIKLPSNLSDLCVKLEDINLMKFINNNEPTMCLFCGKIMNIQQQNPLHKFKLGECTNHYRNECPYLSTYGIFLMIKSNTIYLSYGNRGTFYNTPYRNIFGEYDKEFKFGSPVFLDNLQYGKFVKDILLGNLIPHIIYRRTDSNLDLGGWETL